MGISYLLTSVFAIFYDLQFGKTEFMYCISLIFVVIGCLLGLGAIPAVSRIIGGEDNLLVKWISHLAFLGFAILAIDFIRILQHRFGYHYWAPPRAPLALDPMGIFGFWGIGSWVIVVNVLGIRHGSLPKWIARIGIVFGIIHLPLTFKAECPPPAQAQLPMAAEKKCHIYKSLSSFMNLNVRVYSLSPLYYHFY